MNLTDICISINIINLILIYNLSYYLKKDNILMIILKVFNIRKYN